MTPDDPTPLRHFEPIFPGDPRLTAYAFGELEGDDLAMIEAALTNDETLRAVVEELRAFAGDLTSSLAAEIASEIANERATENANEKENQSANESLKKATAAAAALIPAANETAAHAAHDKPQPARQRSPRGILLRFPFALSYLAPALAACLAVVFWTRHDNEGQREQARVAPVSFALQVADTPSTSKSAIVSGIASRTNLAEARSDTVPSVSFSPVVPALAPASYASFGAAPLAPGSQALVERDVAAPLLVDAASATSVADTDGISAARESTDAFAKDARVSEAPRAGVSGTSKRVIYEEFAARSVSPAAAKAAPSAKAARMSASTKSVNLALEKTVVLVEKDSVLGGGITSGGQLICAWDKSEGFDYYVGTVYVPNPNRYFSTKLFHWNFVYPNAFPAHFDERNLAVDFILDDQTDNDLLFLLWGASRLNRILQESPPFESSREGTHELRSLSLTPLINGENRSIYIIVPIDDRCRG